MVFQFTGSETLLSASSSGVVSVCPGKHLRLVCTVNHSLFLEWAIALPQRSITQTLRKNIPYTGMESLPSINETFNGTDTVVFHFTRTSEAKTLPLITELLIDRVNPNLNGTDIHCSPSNDSDPQITFIIHIHGDWWYKLSIISITPVKSYHKFTICNKGMNMALKL